NRVGSLDVWDGAGYQSIALSGTGTGAAPTVSLTPATPLTFAPLQVGGTSAAQTVTLTNMGSGPLSIQSISISGMNFRNFMQSNNCGPSLAAGASCLIDVLFIPNAVGNRVGSLDVWDGAGYQSVLLSGTGQ
ncbi:MAG TPA: choice-of-anchor D domain-containing protein, partial [Gallionella sp.]|nr:choice-of-anchor D domain-containing protein [Gallionella sp.]